MKHKLCVCLVILLFALPVSAAIYTTETTDSSVVPSIRYSNGEPSVVSGLFRAMTLRSAAGSVERDSPTEETPESERINAITLTYGDGYVRTSTIQTPKISMIFVSAEQSGVEGRSPSIDFMQTTTEPGYPVLEIYWNYDRDALHPWQYYMRVNNLDDTQAVYSDFNTRSIWVKPITPARTAELIGGGIVPEWSDV